MITRTTLLFKNRNYSTHFSSTDNSATTVKTEQWFKLKLVWGYWPFLVSVGVIICIAIMISKMVFLWEDRYQDL